MPFAVAMRARAATAVTFAAHASRRPSGVSARSTLVYAAALMMTP
jgi:hypothetical protein